MFVIPCKYIKEKSQIIECVESIKLHHPEEKIFIVDSISDDLSYLNSLYNLENVIISKKGNTNYVIGALWIAYEHFPEERHYTLIHDSVTIKKPLTNFLQNEQNYSFLYFIEGPRLIQDQPTIDRFVGPNYRHNPYSQTIGIFGSMCILKNGLIKKFIKNNLNKTFLPENKIDCMISERAIGVLFRLEGIDPIENCVEQKNFLEHINTMQSDGFEYIKKTIVSRQ